MLLLALLTRLAFLAILALRERSFALLTVDIALLALTHLPIAILPYPLREGSPVEDRRLDRRGEIAGLPPGARRAILSILLIPTILLILSILAFASDDLIDDVARRCFAGLGAHRTRRAIRHPCRGRVFCGPPRKSRRGGGRRGLVRIVPPRRLSRDGAICGATAIAGVFAVPESLDLTTRPAMRPAVENVVRDAVVTPPGAPRFR